MSSKLGARHLIAATAGTIRRQGRAMLAAAPWSLAVFTLTLPFALLVYRLNQARDLLWVALALVNLIALSRMTFAWHRVVVLQGAGNTGNTVNTGAARGGTAEAKHLLLLSALTIGTAVLMRATGDIPFVLYMMLDAPANSVFFGSVIAAIALVWVPVLYLLATIGPSLPRAVATGEYGFRSLRAAMRYPRWPVMLTLFLLIVIATFAYGYLFPLTYFVRAAELAKGVFTVLLSVFMTFVLMTMLAVAYRDSAQGASI